MSHPVLKSQISPDFLSYFCECPRERSGCVTALVAVTPVKDTHFTTSLDGELPTLTNKKLIDSHNSNQSSLPVGVDPGVQRECTDITVIGESPSKSIIITGCGP